MNLYDPSLAVQTYGQGLQQANADQMAIAQAPTPAQVFLDRLRQSKQDQLQRDQFDWQKQYQTGILANTAERNQITGENNKLRAMLMDQGQKMRFQSAERANAAKEEANSIREFVARSGIPLKDARAQEALARADYLDQQAEKERQMTDTSDGPSYVQQGAQAQIGERNAHARWYDNWQNAIFNAASVKTGMGGDNPRMSPQWTKMYQDTAQKMRGETKNPISPYFGWNEDKITQAATAAADAGVTAPNAGAIPPPTPPRPQGTPKPTPKPQGQGQGTDWGIKMDTLGKNPRFKNAVWMDNGPGGPAWYEKRNGQPVKVE